MATEIHELLGGKGIAASTIKNFYQRKMNPRRKTIEAIQQWIDKEKKKDTESEVKDNKNNEDINISNNNIIDNNSNSNSGSWIFVRVPKE